MLVMLGWYMDAWMLVSQNQKSTVLFLSAHGSSMSAQLCRHSRIRIQCRICSAPPTIIYLDGTSPDRAPTASADLQPSKRVRDVCASNTGVASAAARSASGGAAASRPDVRPASSGSRSLKRAAASGKSICTDPRRASHSVSNTASQEGSYAASERPTHTESQGGSYAASGRPTHAESLGGSHAASGESTHAESQGGSRAASGRSTHAESRGGSHAASGESRGGSHAASKGSQAESQKSTLEESRRASRASGKSPHTESHGDDAAGSRPKRSNTQRLPHSVRGRAGVPASVVRHAVALSVAHVSWMPAPGGGSAFFPRLSGMRYTHSAAAAAASTERETSTLDWHNEAGMLTDAELPVPTEPSRFGEYRRAANTYLGSSDGRYDNAVGLGFDGPSQPHTRTEVGDSAPVPPNTPLSDDDSEDGSDVYTQFDLAEVANELMLSRLSHPAPPPSPVSVDVIGGASDALARWLDEHDGYSRTGPLDEDGLEQLYRPSGAK